MIQILVDTFVKQSSPQPIITVALNLLNHKTRRAEKRSVTCQYSSLTTLSPDNFISTQNSLESICEPFRLILLTPCAFCSSNSSCDRNWIYPSPPTSRVDIKAGQPTVTAEPLAGKIGGQEGDIYLFIRTFARARAVIASIADFTNVLGLRQIVMDSTAADVKNQDRIVGGE